MAPNAVEPHDNNESVVDDEEDDDKTIVDNQSQINTERDLEFLVFGNPLMPDNMLTHLPPIAHSIPAKIDYEILDTEVADCGNMNIEAY